jgi:hypothetical protein
LQCLTEHQRPKLLRMKQMFEDIDNEIKPVRPSYAAQHAAPRD